MRNGAQLALPGALPKPDNSQTDKRGFSTKYKARLFLASTEIAKARGDTSTLLRVRPHRR